MTNTITLACKIIPIEQIIRCSFGLGKSDYIILQFLLKEKEEKSIQDIQKIIKKDRTTIQKSINHLLNLELIKRRQMNIETGGYLYYYKIKDKKSIKNTICANFENLKQKILKEL